MTATQRPGPHRPRHRAGRRTARPAPAAPAPRPPDGAGPPFAPAFSSSSPPRPAAHARTKGHSHPQSDKDEFKTT